MQTKTRRQRRPNGYWEDVILPKAAEIVGSYDTPVTLRQLFYRLVSAGIIDNTPAEYVQLGHRTAAARRDGWFPALIDRTREIVVPPAWIDAEDARAWMRDQFQIDRTEGQGRIDYSLRADDGFLKAGVPLLDWALAHMHCCRKPARRIYALVVLDRVDEARSEANNWMVGLRESFREALRRLDEAEREASYGILRHPKEFSVKFSHDCWSDLQHALDTVDHHFNLTFSGWAERNLPKRPWILEAEQDLLYFNRDHSHCALEKEVQRFERLESKWWISFDWPEYIDTRLSTREKVSQVWEQRKRLKQANGRLRLFHELGKNGSSYNFAPSTNLLDGQTGEKVTTGARHFTNAWNSVLGIAYKLVGKGLKSHEFRSSDHEDDLLQEARLAVFQAIQRYEGKAKFSTYAYAAIWNRLQDYIERESRWETLASDLQLDDLPVEGKCGDPADLAIGRLDLVNTLAKTKDGELLLLHAAGYSDEELLVRHGPHTKMRRHRAKKALQSRLA